MEKLQQILSSSRLLFSVALVFILLTGGALIFTLENYEQTPALSSEFISRKPKTEQPAKDNQPEKADQANKPEKEVATDSDQKTPEPKPQSQNTTLDCSDCTYAAVDKSNALPSSYAPSVVDVGLTGGGRLTAKAAAGLKDLFAGAKAKGINAAIISSYRSYSTQASTFEYWVSTELNGGLSRTEAEAKANTYSARPGHSEHQLGTTVDLKCADCGDFDATANKAIYKFLEDNAHKYGFVISYPKGQDSLTGYTYEPWHIRWIGKDLAGELYDTGYTSGNGNYLAKFLRDQGLSD